MSGHRLDDLESGKHTEAAVEPATRADGVDVRPHHHGCERRIGTGVGRDDVADPVDRHVEAEVRHPRHDEAAALAVGVGEREPSVAPIAGGPVDATDLAEGVEPGGETEAVDSP
ncbi:MAG: hypothetical protein R2715_08340 [Ilumatobacteraceae bacterium]